MNLREDFVIPRDARCTLLYITITLQTFGHRHGGTIYGFLFTSDILNNLLVGGLSSAVLAWGGWTGFFLVLAGWVVAQLYIDFFHS